VMKAEDFHGANATRLPTARVPSRERPYELFGHVVRDVHLERQQRGA
jgi:hypothetical protein